MGGLSKKAALFNTLSSTSDTPALLLDAGNQLFKQSALPAAPTEAEAARIRARGIVLAHQTMGLQFAAIGTHDLAAGPNFLKEIAGSGFTWLSLNLSNQQNDGLLFPGYVLRQAGQLTVAVLALTNHDSATPADGSSYHIRPWREVLPAAMAQLRQRAHLIILLSNYPLGENREIARTFPQIDLIFQSGHAMGNMPPIAVGNTLINQTETRGRYMGLLEIDWQGRGSWRQPGKSALSAYDRAGSSFRQRFIPLNASMENDPAIDALVRQTEKQAQALTR